MGVFICVQGLAWELVEGGDAGGHLIGGRVGAEIGREVPVLIHQIEKQRMSHLVSRGRGVIFNALEVGSELARHIFELFCGAGHSNHVFRKAVAGDVAGQQFGRVAIGVYGDECCEGCFDAFWQAGEGAAGFEEGVRAEIGAVGETKKDQCFAAQQVILCDGFAGVGGQCKRATELGTGSIETGLIDVGGLGLLATRQKERRKEGDRLSHAGTMMAGIVVCQGVCGERSVAP